MYEGPGIYEHYKGGTYRVHGVSTHSETGEKCVVYAGEEMWHRPLAHFDNPVQTEGGTIPRFLLVRPGSTSRFQLEGRLAALEKKVQDHIDHGYHPEPRY